MSYDYDRDFDAMFKGPFDAAEWQAIDPTIRYDLEITDYEVGDTCWTLIERTYDDNISEMGNNVLGIFIDEIHARDYIQNTLKGTKR